MELGHYACCVELDDTPIGNTTINATEQQIADIYVETDANVSISQGYLCIDLLAEHKSGVI
ncbi:MAG: hypothetical protein RLN85_17015, partial [Pseudomonadales bacterium]